MTRKLIFAVFALCLLCLSPLGSAPTPVPKKVPKELLKARLKIARLTYYHILGRRRGGVATISEMFGWSQRWLDAELPLCETDKARLAAYREHALRTREEDQAAQRFAKAGFGKQEDADAATYYRMEAEILLLQAGGQLPKAGEKPTPIVESPLEGGVPLGPPLPKGEGKVLPAPPPPSESDRLPTSSGPEKGKVLPKPKPPAKKPS